MALTPFDGLSAELGESIKALTEAGLETRGSHIRETGEDITGNRVYSHDLNMTYTIVGKKIFLNGSVHKYSNAGEHNYNDFTVQKLSNVLRSFHDHKGINPAKAVLHNIEFGVNIVLETDVSEVLKSLLTYKGKPFEKFTTKGDGYQCKTEEFIIKVYNKGKQYKQKENIIRVEIKVTRMRFLKSKRIAIKTIADLLRLEYYPVLAKLIGSYFKDILFLNRDLDIQGLDNENRELYLKGSNKSYWERPDKKKIGDKTAYDREYKRQEREEEKFRELNKSEIIQDLIKRLNKKLTQISDYTEFELSENHRQIENWNCPKITAPQNALLSENHTLYIGELSDKDKPENKVSVSNKKELKPKFEKKIPDRKKREVDQPKVGSPLSPPIIYKPVPQIKRRSAIAAKKKVTFNVDLNDRPNKDGLYSVFIRITENRKSVRVMMNFRIAKDHFSKENGSWISPLNLKSGMFNREIEKWIEELKNRYDDLSRIHDNPLAFIKCKVEEATVGNYFNDYLIRIREVCEPAYYKKLKSVFGQFISFLSPDYPLNQVETMEIHQFRRWRLAEGDVEATIANKLKNIHTVFTIALSEELIIRDPFPKIPQSKYLNHGKNQ